MPSTLFQVVNLQLVKTIISNSTRILNNSNFFFKEINNNYLESLYKLMWCVHVGQPLFPVKLSFYFSRAKHTWGQFHRAA